MPVRKMLLDALMTYMGGKLNGKSLSNTASQIGVMLGVMSCSLYLMWTVSMKVCQGSCTFLTCINNMPILYRPALHISWHL